MQYGDETIPWLPSTGPLPGDKSREIEGGGGKAACQAETAGGKAASFTASPIIWVEGNELLALSQLHNSGFSSVPGYSSHGYY